MTEDVFIACLQAAADVSATADGNRAELFRDVLASAIEAAEQFVIEETDDEDDDEQ